MLGYSWGHFLIDRFYLGRSSQEYIILIVEMRLGFPQIEVFLVPELLV
jgi:hypothetical protein